MNSRRTLEPGRLKNVLLISHVLPTPPNSGGRQRTDQLCRAIQRVARLHTLFLLDPQGQEPDTLDQLREQYGMQSMLPAPRLAERVLARWPGAAAPSVLAGATPLLLPPASDYKPHPQVAQTAASLVSRLRIDMIVGRYMRGVCIADGFAHCPVVVDLDDADDQILASHAANPQHSKFVRWLFHRQAGRTRRAMQPVLARAAHVWVCNPNDRASLADPSGQAISTVSELPNIPYHVPARVSPAPASGMLLAVADWRHGFNKNGLQSFLDDCWPAIRQLPSSPTLTVAGSAFPDELSDRLRKTDGIRIVHSPTATALDTLYEQAAFCIAPVAGGAGTSLKVLEALARARTLVLTPSAWRGYQERLPHHKCVRIGANAAQLVAACRQLLEAPDYAAALGQHGRHLLCQGTGQAAFDAEVAATIDAVVGVGRSTP